MTYINKPKNHHPNLKKNSLGLTRRDYEGAVSSLCAGCGHDSISAAIIESCYELSLSSHQIVKLSGIGCSSKSPAYFLNQSHGFNSVHGRMPSVATGANLGNHELIYLGVSGDGDTASIGIGQFIHAARRQLNLVYIVENNGIVFIDEFDKITAHTEARGGDVSREGVQRDLLPLIEGTTVTTKYGMIKTDHVLFIASGAFHLAKPSDLLPELQGRLPIRVELRALTEQDFVRILTEPEASLIKQYIALMATEKVTLNFSENAINEIASLAAEINSVIENIGARRLHTVLEKLLEDISFTATDREGETIKITSELVKSQVGALVKGGDLSKFIL